MATKTEMVDVLNEAGKGTKTALKKLEVEELEKMVAELGEGSQEEQGQEPVEPTEPPAEQAPEETPDEPEVKHEGEVVSVAAHQLGIFTEFIYHVKHKGANVKVENLGFGDVYVSDEEPKVGNKKLRVLTGEEKVFEGVEVIRAIAASQPEIKITEIK